MRRLLALVALATMVASACNKNSEGYSVTGPSPTTTPAITVTPAGRTPAMGESWKIEIDLPSPVNVSPTDTVIVGWVFIRDDGARMGNSCTTPQASSSSSMDPNSPLVLWALGKGHSISRLDFLIGTDTKGRIGRCPFAQNNWEVNGAVMSVVSYPLGWTWEKG
mgnify:CR=1 FL=1